MSSTPASFNDGETAARRGVTVGLELDGLRIVDGEGRQLALWPYEELEHLDEVFDDEDLRLKVRGNPAARLVLANRELLDEIVALAPQLRVRRRGWGRLSLRWAGLTAASVAALVFVLWVALPRFAEATAKVIPISWEVALGERVLEQVTGLFARLEDQEEPLFCDAEAGRLVLDRLSGELARVAESPYEFKISVLDLDVPNAFALPGGRIVIFRGLLDFAESPDEIAGVLAHEMGHVMHRHGTEGLLKSLGLTFFFGVMLGDLGSGIVGVAGESLVSMSFSREAENEADATAVELLRPLDISTKGMAAFFARLQEMVGDMDGVWALVSSHPTNASRQALFAQDQETGGASLSEAEWQSLKAICPAAVEEEEAEPPH